MKTETLIERTKGEWVTHSTGIFTSNDENGEYPIFDVPEAEMSSQQKVDAAFICKAVNNYDSLLKTLYNLANAATHTTKNLVGFDGAPKLDKAIDEAFELYNNLKNY